MSRLLLLALLLPVRLPAQTPGTFPVAPPKPRLGAVSVGTFPLLAGGYHLSLEKPWRPGSRHSVVLTPQWYRGRVHDLTSDLHQNGADRVRGYGLDVQHRIYLGPQLPAFDGFYVGYGVSYQHFRMQFQAPGWLAEPGPDGLYYYQYRLRDQTETIDRYSASAVLGRQVLFPNTPVFFDAYLGIGLRKATSRSVIPGNYYAASMSDYGHEGLYIPVGFRLGVAL